MEPLTPDLFSDNVDPGTNADVISQALIRLRSTTKVYIHHQTVSFTESDVRRSWGKQIDTNHRGVFEELGEQPYKIVKIAHFSSRRISWAPAITFDHIFARCDQFPWHNWTAAIIRHTSDGSISLIIYDNNAKAASHGDRCPDILRLTQLALLEYLLIRNRVRVFYHTDQSERGTDLSLPVSMRRIEKLAAYGDIQLDLVTGNEPRLQNCVVLRNR